MSAALPALVELLLAGVAPLSGYWMWQRQRYKRTFRDTAQRAGLQLGRPRYLVYSLLIASVIAAALVIWSPPMEPFAGQGSMYRQFAGLGLGGQAVAMALLVGVVQTGFAEELLFRGLIAGSLSRRLTLVQANLAQAILFTPTFRHSICRSRDVDLGHVAGGVGGRSHTWLGANSIRLNPGVLADTRVRQRHYSVTGGGTHS